MGLKISGAGGGGVKVVDTGGGGGLRVVPPPPPPGQATLTWTPSGGPAHTYSFPTDWGALDVTLSMALGFPAWALIDDVAFAIPLAPGGTFSLVGWDATAPGQAGKGYAIILLSDTGSPGPLDPGGVVPAGTWAAAGVAVGSDPNDVLGTLESVYFMLSQTAYSALAGGGGNNNHNVYGTLRLADDTGDTTYTIANTNFESSLAGNGSGGGDFTFAGVDTYTLGGGGTVNRALYTANSTFTVTGVDPLTVTGNWTLDADCAAMECVLVHPVAAYSTTFFDSASTSPPGNLTGQHQAAASHNKELTGGDYVSLRFFLATNGVTSDMVEFKVPISL